MSHRMFASLLLVIVAAASVLVATGNVAAGTTSQSTPAPGPITTDLLGRVEPADAPGKALFLLRVTFDPGAEVAAHVHPGTTIYHLTSGTLTFSLQEGEARVVRATDGVPAIGTPAAMEDISAGSEVTLNAGDTVYYDGSAVQVERNDGNEPAVVLISNLRDADAPPRQFVDETPAS